MSDEPGFFRNLAGYATEWVTQKRRNLAPITDVDKAGGRGSYSFDGQEFDHSDLREVKHIRESGGQVATLMETKALLNFGEGVEIQVDTSEDEEPPTEIIDGEELTLSEYLHQQFPALDLLVLNLGEDALYYPYATAEIRENRAGEFKDLLPAEPWTLVPKTNRKGEIQAWIQETRQNGTRKTQTLNPDDIVHFVLNKNSARDTTGISEILRNKDEIDAFKANQEAIAQAIELHGFPQRHIKVGRENGAPVNDDELRRVRQIFDPQSTDANTAYFSGQDVSVETLEAHNFDYTAIHEMDMRNLTTALGLPLELGNVGADGLGSGKPAELRLAMLKLSIKANQRRFTQQFVEKVFRPVIEQYSPFDADADIRLEFGDPLEDIGDMADVITSVGEYMTNAEVREKLDLPAPDDDEIAEGYRTPADIEAPEEEQGGGLFGEAAEQAVDQELDERDLDGDDTDFRGLDTPQGVPPNAQGPVSDRSEVPEGASTFQGPQGGLYFLPAGQEPEGEGTDKDLPEGAEEQINIDEVENSEVVETFAGNSFTTPEEFGDLEEAEPGVPIVAETPRGEMEAGILVEAREEASGTVAVYEQADGEAMFAGAGENRDIVGLADKEQMGDEELREYSQNRIETGPDFQDIPDDVQSQVVTTAQNGIISNLRDTDLAVQLSEEMNLIRDETDRAFHSIKGDGSQVAFQENGSESTIHHEFGHALHTTLGYRNNSGANKVAWENSAGRVPDFSDEYAFGEFNEELDEEVPEFDEFLISDEDGNKPGQRQAKIERAVANASMDEFETQSLPDNEPDQVQEALDLERGDMAKFETQKGEMVGRFVTREDAFIGDELIQFEVLVDEDGNTPDERRLEGIKTDTDIRDNPEFKLGDDFKGKIDKEATAQNTEFEVPQPRGGSGEQSSEEKFFAEVNRAWAESAAHSEAGRDYVAESTSIKDGYSVNNTHETTARAVEALQNGDENAIEDMAENQPEMLGALLEIMDAPDGLDELLEGLGI